MTQSRRTGILILIVFFISSHCYSKNVDSIARFGTYFTSYFQPESADSRSGLLLWSPAKQFNKHITFLTDIGLTYLNTPDSKYFAVYLSPRFDFQLSTSWSVDLSVGTQNWTTEGGFLPMAGMGVNYHFHSEAIPFLDTVRIAGNRIWKTDFPTWQVNVGFEFNLGSHEVSNPQKETPPPPPKEIEVTKEGIKLTLAANRISFQLAKSDILPKAKEYLSEIAKVFLAHKEQWSEISITGHTDNAGKPGLNKWLSQSRAESVASFFKEKGLDANRILANGVGDSEPIASNETPEGRRANRRVEISIKSGTQKADELISKLEQINKKFNAEK